MTELVAAQGPGGLGGTFSASAARIRGSYDSKVDSHV